MELGEPARQHIRGHSANYYLQELALIRAETLTLLQQRDDSWLWEVGAASDNANNYWQWYHVYEDEINHRGEMNWRLSRMDLTAWPPPQYRFFNHDAGTSDSQPNTRCSRWAESGTFSGAGVCCSLYRSINVVPPAAKLHRSATILSALRLSNQQKECFNDADYFIAIRYHRCLSDA
jgi:hypothetical protein